MGWGRVGSGLAFLAPAEEGVLGEHLEAAVARRDAAEARATLDERVAMMARQNEEAKALRKQEASPGRAPSGPVGVGVAVVRFGRELGGGGGGTWWPFPGRRRRAGRATRKGVLGGRRLAQVPAAGLRTDFEGRRRARAHASADVVS